MRTGAPTIAGLMVVIFYTGLALALMRVQAPDIQTGLWVLLAASVPYVVAPIRFRRSFRQPPPGEFEEIDLADPSLPESIAKILATVSLDLKEMGFLARGILHIPNRRLGAEEYAAVFEACEDGTIAIYSLLPYRHEQATNWLPVLSFHTTFDDGPALISNNSRALTFFPRLAQRAASMSYPHVRSASRLLELHRAALDRDLSRPSRVNRPGLGPLDYLRARALAQIGEQVSLGYLDPVPGPDGYRPTRRGAILLCWKQAWPILQIRRARARSRALQRELALTPRPPAALPSCRTRP